MLRQASTKYQNVYSVIKNNIASNKWPVGKIIPSEHELVDYFRVSRITIRSALNMLENDGLVTRKRGKGTIVKNTTNKTMTAQAVPSVAPSNAAEHLKKLECFCFEQQELKPGEEALLPVKLLVSNELPSNIKNIILSYTIFDITEYNDDEKLAHHQMDME